MEMTSEMKKYKAQSTPVYQSYGRGERLRRKGVLKEISFKFL
jgi:hypothetical protein